MESNSPSPPLPPSGETSGPQAPPVLQPLPPPVISPLPPPTTSHSVPPAIPEHILSGRLHPLSLLFTAWGAIRNLLLPLIVVLVFGRKQSMDNYVFLGAALLVVPLVIGVARYFTFTYRIQNGELIVRHGVVRRTHRVIPLNRVQDIRVEQSYLHRMFGVAEIYVETAGGQGAEAALSVLARNEADRLRQAMYAASKPGSTTVPAEQKPGLPEREVLRQLGLRDLVLAGITSNQIASALVIIFVLWGFVDDVIPRETLDRFVESSTRWLTNWFEHAGDKAWITVAFAIVGLLVAGVLFSVIGSIVMFHGFTLSRSGEDLHRAYGLFTRRSSSLPRRRIQVLKIEETLLRRFFGLATLRADTAASKVPNQQAAGGKDVLLPVISKAELSSLLPVFLPRFPVNEIAWNKVSRRAIRRGMFKGSAVCIILAGVSWGIQRHPWALWPLGILPLVYWLNVLSFRHYGYWLNSDYFCSRRGWLGRSTHVVPIPNVQALVFHQTPFDRRHKVATLLVDTAGQAYTGGAPRLENVPQEEALAVARKLAKQAASTRYRV